MICVLFLFCSIVISGPVPDTAGYVTRVEAAAIVLAAHNNLDGAHFADLEPGDMIRYHDGGGWSDYRVREIVTAEAVRPADPRTPLVIGGEELTVPQVYAAYLADPATLALYTCVERGGVATWGRMFVVAELLE